MNLAGVIGAHADDQIALIDGDDRVDFGTLRGRVAAMQVELQERGVGVDSTVALATGNDVAFVLSTLAVLGLGGIVMPLNPGSPTSELARKLAVAEPSMLLVGHAGRLHLGDPAVGTPTVDLIEMAANAAAAHASGEAPATPVIVDRPDDAPAFYMATSGVSGAAKVAVLSHHNLSWIHGGARSEIDPPLTADNITLGVAAVHAHLRSQRGAARIARSGRGDRAAATLRRGREPAPGPRARRDDADRGAADVAAMARCRRPGRLDGERGVRRVGCCGASDRAVPRA